MSKRSLHVGSSNHMVICLVSRISGNGVSGIVQSILETVTALLAIINLYN